MHSGFVLGLAILIVLLAVSFVARVASGGKSGMAGYLPTTGFFLLGAVAATLVTPFQFRLYAYLPQLFFSPMNKYNQELLPLSLPALLSSDFLPFLILQIVFFVSILYLLNLSLRGRASAFYMPAAMALAITAAILLIASDCCRRMIPFAVLVLFPYFWLWARVIVEPGSKKSLPAPINFMGNAFEKAIGGSKQFIALILIAIFSLLLGTNACATQFPAAIPQETFAFAVPAKAAAFIQATRPAGNMLNDPQFGDVLIFRQGETAQVFIDTRFDLYGPKFCHDYFVMANCLHGYQKLMEQYQIKWIFFPHQAPITTKLAKDPRWKIAYEDRAAVIMVKQR